MRKLFLANNGSTSKTSANHFINARWAEIKDTTPSEHTFLMDAQGFEVSLNTDERIELLDAIVMIESDEYIFVHLESTATPSPEFIKWIASTRNWKKPEIAFAETTATKVKVIVGDTTYYVAVTTATDEQFKNGNVIFFNEEDADFYEPAEHHLFCSVEGNLWLRKNDADKLTYMAFSIKMKKAMKSPLKMLRKHKF